MAGKRERLEDIATMLLRRGKVLQAHGAKIADAGRQIGVIQRIHFH